ncbi:MAG TPA: hypothetical protein VJV79_19400 [Polyangiaceae bacterium]|nr:hypothetical protein [Polyangiaceae bacterium]
MPARPIVPSVAGASVTQIPVRRMTRASDFAALDRVTVLHFVVVSGDQEARAIAAELEAYLIERTDTLINLSESERQASNEVAFEFVRRLEQHGCVVCTGVDQAELRFDDDPGKTRAWNMGCICIANQSDEAPFVTIEN